MSKHSGDLRSEAIHTLFMAHRTRGTDPGLAEGFYREALGIFEQLDYANGVVETLIGLAHLKHVHTDESHSLFQQALTRVEGVSDLKHRAILEAHVLKGLAQLLIQSTDPGTESVSTQDEARSLLERALVLYEGADEWAGMANTHHRLGLLDFQIGSRKHFERSAIEIVVGELNAESLEAIRHFEKAAALLRKAGQENQAASNAVLAQVVPGVLRLDDHATQQFNRIMRRSEITIV